MPAIFSLWGSLYSLINSLFSFLFYRLNRLISFNCGALSLVFNSFSVSLLNLLQIFNMLLKMHAREVTVIYSIILVSTTEVLDILVSPYSSLTQLYFQRPNYLHLSFIASALEARFQFLAYLTWLLSPFYDSCFPECWFCFINVGCIVCSQNHTLAVGNTELHFVSVTGLPYV